jgi:lysyl-tRNA synthetase, class I
LMLRTPPKTVINFSPNYETIARLFRDYDVLIDKCGDDKEAIPTDAVPAAEKDLAPLRYSQLGEQIKTYQPFDISTLISLLQVPHLDIEAEIAKRSDRPLTEFDWQVVRQRVTVAQRWLQDYADEEEKLVLYLDRVPDRAQEITLAQKAYFQQLIQNLEVAPNWDGEELQTLLFSTAKELEFSQKDAFQAIYLCFLGKDKGPKAGSLLSYLDKSFAIARLKEVVQNQY